VIPHGVGVSRTFRRRVPAVRTGGHGAAASAGLQEKPWNGGGMSGSGLQCCAIHAMRGSPDGNVSTRWNCPCAIAARTWSSDGDGPVPVNPPIGSTSSPFG
jgi:hypothetical protein